MKKWIKDHMDWVVTIGLAVAIVLVGCYVFLTLDTELRDHPEIKEFTGPDITNLGPVVVCVLVAALVIEIVLWLGKPGKTP